RAGTRWRPSCGRLPAGGDGRLADVRLDSNSGLSGPFVQAALDALPKVIAQPGIALQVRQPVLSCAFDHRRVPAQSAQYGNRLGGLDGLAASGDDRLHDRVQGVVDDLPEQFREGWKPRVAAAVPQIRVAGAGECVPARTCPDFPEGGKTPVRRRLGQDRCGRLDPRFEVALSSGHAVSLMTRWLADGRLWVISVSSMRR